MAVVQSPTIHLTAACKATTWHGLQCAALPFISRGQRALPPSGHLFLGQLAEALPAGGRTIAVLGHHAAGQWWGGGVGSRDEQPAAGITRRQRCRGNAARVQQQTAAPAAAAGGCARALALPTPASPQQSGGGAVGHGVAALVAPHGHRLLKHGARGGPVARPVRLVACRGRGAVRKGMHLDEPCRSRAGEGLAAPARPSLVGPTSGRRGS